MNISVRVLSAAAQAQIKALQAEVASLSGQLARANATAATPTGIGGSRFLASIGKLGTRMQWVGRQLQYNLTLPILLAAGAATKFALDNEKAFTRVKKLYGDTTEAVAWFKKHQDQIPKGMNAAQASANTFKTELNSLGKAFESLSSRYGVAQKDVIETGAAWAAAGVSGVALAKSTELSIKASLIGDMDLAKSTQSLMSIQAQYSLSTKQLNLTLSELNAIENQTGISMSGLIDGFGRSAGVAREYGVDVRHLGAMLAALVPSTGSAATAGNSLKTIMSRLLNPTEAARKVMHEFGVDTSDAAWQSSTAMDRLMIISQHLNGTLDKTAKGGYKISDSQRAVVGATLGSNYQVNRFLVLMRELNPEYSYYEKALNATANRQKVFAQSTKELNSILDSSPQKLHIIWSTIQNGMATAIQPMIPYIIYLAQSISKLMQAFSNLNPSMQKFIIGALLMTAALGPVLRLLSSFYLLGRIIVTPLIFLSGALARVVVDLAAFAGVGVASFVGIAAAIAAAVAAIVILVYHYRDSISKAWNDIVSYFSDSSNAMVKSVIGAWYALPNGITSALVAVVKIVSQAAMQIYEWMSYINPFAHHSPSLVENVTNGMAIVSARFGGAADAIKGHLSSAYASIKAFGNATKGLLDGAASLETAKDRKTVKKFAPGALQEFDALSAHLKTLNADLAVLDAVMARQQAVVDRWTQKVASANKELDKQQKILDGLIDKQSKWQAKLEEAQTRLENFASAPIQGMGAMSDAIFANEMAQKRLRLEMMNMEDVTGPLDDIKSRIDAISGAQELLRGEQSSLRSAGAGSDILSQYDNEISALDQQKVAQTDAMKAVDDMTKAMAALERQGQRLDLQNSIQFDPLLRQIDKVAHAQKELSFDAIMQGMKDAQVDIVNYQAKLDLATAAVDAQQKVVDQATATRDRAQAGLDREEASLGRIKDRYDAVASAISAVKDAMSQAVQAADAMQSKLDAAAAKVKKPEAVSPAVQNFRDAKGGNFAQVGGSGIPIRTDFSSQSAAIDKFVQDQSDKAAKAFGDVNPFSSIKNKMQDAKDWMSKKWTQISDDAVAIWDNMVAKLTGNSKISESADNFRIAWAKASDFITSNVIDPILKAWAYVSPKLSKIISDVIDNVVRLFQEISPSIKPIIDEVKKMGPAFQGFWNIVKPVLAFFAAGIAIAFNSIVDILGKVIQPAFDTIRNGIKDVLQFILGAIQVVSGFFMLFEPGHFQEGINKLSEGLKNMLLGTIKGIYNLITGILNVIVYAFWGMVNGIIDAAKWLYDEMIGHSIIPDLINGITDWFAKLKDLPGWIYDHTIKPIVKTFEDGYDSVISSVKDWWGGITDAWNNIKNGVKDWWHNNVWGPVKNGVTEWWANRLIVWASWWDAIKGAWNNITSNVKSWWHDNVWDPIKNGVTEWWANRLIVWASWWDAIKTAWNNITSNVKSWWHDNIWSPIATGLTDWWANRLVVWASWWGMLKDAWANIKDNIGQWWSDNVTDPIFNKVTGVWDKISTWFTNNKNILTKPVGAVVNVVIGAVNSMINGLNKVSDILPGVKWHIEAIPELAAGGALMERRVGSGFKTNGARAIVGEGKANHPEFVIPTDPTYRNRAKGLLAMAAQKMGMDTAAIAMRNSPALDEHGIPAFASGGWLSDTWNATKGIAKKVANLPAQAVSVLMGPVLDKAQELVNKAGWKPGEIPPSYGIQQIRNWVSDADTQAASTLASMVPSGGNVPVGIPDMPEAGNNWKGGWFTNKFVAHLEKAEEIAGSNIRVIQGGFRPATSYSGTSHQGDAIDTDVNEGIILALRRVGIAAGDRTGLGDWSPHVHAIPGPSAGYGAGSAPWQWSDYMARGGMNQALNSPWGLARGAIIRGGRGGVNARIGEGSKDELVTPLPSNWKMDELNGGGKTYIFNGDLSFPNITDPADAKELIRNLENLARD